MPKQRSHFVLTSFGELRGSVEFQGKAPINHWNSKEAQTHKSSLIVDYNID